MLRNVIKPVGGSRGSVPDEKTNEVDGSSDEANTHQQYKRGQVLPEKTTKRCVTFFLGARVDEKMPTIAARLKELVVT